MNQTIKELFSRKSVRVYENRPIESEKKRIILESALQAPTAGNMTLYSIIDVTDENLKKRLSVTCDNQPFIADAPLVLIFCADYSRWYECFCSANSVSTVSTVEDEIRKPGAGDLLLSYTDAVIAAQNAVVAAESLGIGSCYIGDILENYEIHKELLNLPKYVIPSAMLVFGYPTIQQKERVKPTRFNLEDIIHENTYNYNNPNKQTEMLAGVTGKSEEDLTNYIRAFCKRKWNSEFSHEMSRSAYEMIKDWLE